MSIVIQERLMFMNSIKCKIKSIFSIYMYILRTFVYLL